MNAARIRHVSLGILAIVIAVVVFVIPFVFIVLTASKTQQEASLLEFTIPTQWVFWENLVEVLQTRENMLPRALWNSTILTVFSVTAIVILAAMVGYVLQRRPTRWSGLVNALVLSGLIIPPAVVPTIWVLQMLGLFKTMPGMVFMEISFNLSFSIILFRAFISTIPRELDEAALIDGAGPLRIFFRVILPLLKPVVVTVIVIQVVHVFNDFTGPLYFLPGDENVTAQLTLFNFQSEEVNSFNLLFMTVLIITVIPLVLYLFFNRQIVAGMTAGAVKG
ncbi:carbohydrate ABC transporter permease [Microbacterium sp. M28]|uniref:carbohydrate ABC transporter permease n=1 Tax=Microbacterium sp. M28 TaxID=2962064 RepID=UPI0021F43EE0|nr:carbohydrate ABC transporter permease [Microbacterium sp. M28]UYO97111.1 carbohydrate ABC transporter permease [Microbacterium sp. M28]